MGSPAATAFTPARPARLPDALRLGPAHLTVTDLDRALGFYESVLGLRAVRREPGVAEVGAGEGEEPVLVLYEEPGARRAGRHAGLYHVALLYPTREELARAAHRIAAAHAPIQGASDHGTHEAIYLADPDGNGLELAADRPREQWPASFARDGGGARALDTASLLGAVAPEDVPAHVGRGLRVGHVHLHVADVEEALRFYRDAVGFAETARLPQAAFVAAGGYHHHVGFNTWRGQGVPPAPPDAVGLRHFTIVLPSAGDVEAVAARLAAAGAAAEQRSDGLLARDPSGNALLITAASG